MTSTRIPLTRQRSPLRRSPYPLIAHDPATVPATVPSSQAPPGQDAPGTNRPGDLTALRGTTNLLRSIASTPPSSWSCPATAILGHYAWPSRVLPSRASPAGRRQSPVQPTPGGHQRRDQPGPTGSVTTGITASPHHREHHPRSLRQAA